MARNKILEGKVVSDKSAKTATVLVISKSSHHLYKRTLRNKKKYKVHDKDNKAKTGDRVKIIECRPFSKDKRFRLLEILK